MSYQAPLTDIHLIRHDVLTAPAQLRAPPRFAETYAALMRQVVDEAGKIIDQKVAPLQSPGAGANPCAASERPQSPHRWLLPDFGATKTELDMVPPFLC